MPKSTGDNSLLPNPPMLIGESADEFEALRNRLEREIRPNGFIEEIYIADISCILWDILRLRRCKAVIINIAFRSALKELLKQLLREPNHYADAADEFAEEFAADKAESLSLAWFTEQDAKEEVSELLAAFQLDESSIEAEAVRRSSVDLERIDRMLTSLEARRNKALRGIGEYRASLARQLRETADRMIAGTDVLRLEHSSGKQSSAA